MKNNFNTKYGPWGIVTGASDGIGRSMAKVLAKKGLNLVLVARRKELLDTLAIEIQNEFKVEVRVLALNLSEIESIQIIKNYTKDLNIGLLAAIAGYGTSGAFIDSDISDEIQMLKVNCQAVIEQCHHYGSLFAKRGSGGIILVSSIVAFQGVPQSANYAATKAFVQSFAEGIHFELKPYGVDVLVTAPGPVNTGFAKRAKLKMGKAANPTEIAQSTVASLGKAITVRPGFLSKLLGYSLSIMNRWGRIKVMTIIMSGMSKK
ncbi:MAG: SDR family NAD(P)-dependent oxidoreductase [Pseudobdellovibrionaceae bacterium]